MISLNPMVGINAHIELDPISLANGALILQRSPSDALKGALMSINATYQPVVFGAHIEAYAKLLGTAAYVLIKIDAKSLQVR